MGHVQGGVEASGEKICQGCEERYASATVNVYRRLCLPLVVMWSHRQATASALGNEYVL